jgi:sec-independent protein translocase protein TatA
MFGMSFQELAIIGVIAILLFGKRLPEVAKTLGKHYKGLRKQLNEFQSAFDINTDIESPVKKQYKPKTYDEYDDYEEASAPRFEPPPVDK